MESEREIEIEERGEEMVSPLRVKDQNKRHIWQWRFLVNWWLLSDSSYPRLSLFAYGHNHSDTNTSAGHLTLVLSQEEFI